MVACHTMNTKKTYKVSKHMLERFFSINEKMRAITADADYEYHKQFGELTPMQLTVIRIIGQTPACRMKDIAKHAQITVGSVTPIIDYLVNKKIVKRTPSSSDRRVIYAELTPKGKEIINIVTEQVSTIAQKLLSKLTPTEQKQTLDALLRLVE